MTITQTVEIPANRRITLDVPSQIPTGETASLKIIWFPVRQTVNCLDKTLAEIQELCKDIPVSVNSIREERRCNLEEVIDLVAWIKQRKPDGKQLSQIPETMLMSEASLSKDWNSPEEDEAWANL